jgi:hypothetical protein
MSEEQGAWVPWDDSVKPVPYADRPYDEIIPGLWMGGHDYGPDGSPVVIGNEFDHVFSLYQRHGHGPDEGIPHEYVRLSDGKLSEGALDRARDVAGKVHDTLMWFHRQNALDGGDRKILVRCQAGYNRSGLIVGLVLLMSGMDAVSVVDLIREKRGGYALCNAWFVAYICDEEARIRGE